MKSVAVLSAAILVSLSAPAKLPAQNKVPVVEKVSAQPLVAATKRLMEALKFVGSPLPKADMAALQKAMKAKDAEAVAQIQKILDKHVLAAVNINPESRVKVSEGPVAKTLIQHGWQTFLVKVHNEAGVTAKLGVGSPQARPIHLRGRGPRQKLQPKQPRVTPADIRERFLSIASFEKPPLKPRLSGLECEYRIVQLYSRDKGKREARLAFDVGAGTQDLGFRAAVSLLFQAKPAMDVVLTVKDENNAPTTAAFVIKDAQGRVYPNRARRAAPDFFFHDQIYRADGESVSLPPGKYTFTVSRGPEYLIARETVEVKAGQKKQRTRFKLARWVDASARGWHSGDHHVHAAGCAHYDQPTEGVTPADMLRHIKGEDLNVGCVLTWGPCWYYQKQFFSGAVSKLSMPDYLMRYDVEVSGFPSSHAGHLCLLRLKEDDYPGTKKIEQWPSWTLPVLQWGQKQGGVVGYSHSGWGLALPDYGPRGRRVPTRRGKAAHKLPDFAMPPFDGIGANEYIVTVTHGACDFISAVDTPAVWELNIWYHTLNCGYRAVISGETDFPCIYGDKVGLGRVYVKLPKKAKLNFDAWAQGLKVGRSYCGDGRSHIFDLTVADATDKKNKVEMGTPGPGKIISQIDLARPGKVNVTFDVAALIAAQPNAQTNRIRNARLDAKPYWHVERSRIGNTRNVPVELVVNGEAVARKVVAADGKTRSLSFDVDIKKSSWVAVRIFPSVHTNPVYVVVGGKPIRASKKSAEWCRKAVDVCWNAKKNRIRQSDRAAAQAGYDAARKAYDKIIRESK